MLIYLYFATRNKGEKKTKKQNRTTFFVAGWLLMNPSIHWMLDVVSDSSGSETDRNRGMRKVHRQGCFDSCSPCSWRRGRAAVPVRQTMSPSPKSSNLNKSGHRGREACRRALAASQLKRHRPSRNCAKIRRCLKVTAHAPGEGVGRDCGHARKSPSLR